MDFWRQLRLGKDYSRIWVVSNVKLLYLNTATPVLAAPCNFPLQLKELWSIIQMNHYVRKTQTRLHHARKAACDVVAQDCHRFMAIRYQILTTFEYTKQRYSLLNVVCKKKGSNFGSSYIQTQICAASIRCVVLQYTPEDGLH